MTLTLALVLALLVAVPAAADSGDLHGLDEQGHEVVATGLANPRGLHVDGDVLYVAESGRGGGELVSFSSPDYAGFLCVGMTGGVTRVDASGQERISIMPSAGNPAFTPEGPTCDGAPGVAAYGPNDITAIGDTLVVAMANGADEIVRDQVHADFGTLLRLLPNGTYVEMADIVAYEQQHNPDGLAIDANPYGVAADGGRVFVADAGANTVFEVRGRQVRTVAVLEPFEPYPWTPPSCLPGEVPGLPAPGELLSPESVPTQVAIGHDGHLYVSTLPGFPYTPGSAKIFRIDPETGEAEVFADGFSAINGLDVGPDGALYVSEMVDGHLFELSVCGNTIPGRVMRVTEEGTELIGHAPAAGGLAVAGDGSVYVTVDMVSPTDGQVWRFSTD